MAIGDKNEPVDLVVVEPCVVEGKHLELGTVLKKQDPEFAFEMAACGKMRLASPELISDMKARAKAEAAAAEARAAQSAGFVVSEAVSQAPGISAAQLAETVKSAIEQGIQAGIALAAAAIPADPADPAPEPATDAKA